MNSSNRVPIASPHDYGNVPSSSSPSSFALGLGHFLLWAFGGQILFTVLQVVIANETHGRSQAGASCTLQLALMGIPLACALVGVFVGRSEPVRAAAHPLAVVLLLLLIGALGLFNLFVFVLTGMAGYC